MSLACIKQTLFLRSRCLKSQHAHKTLGFVLTSYMLAAQTRPNRTWLSSSPSNSRKDCPLCQKYGTGPCGELFYKWLDCTDECDAQQQPDNMTIKCAPLFEQFQTCLERENDYYNSTKSAQVQATSASTFHNEEVRESWQELIGEDLKHIERINFPADLKPKVTPTTNDSTLMRVSFVADNLVLVFVRLGKDLITAASKEDLLANNNNNERILLVPQPNQQGDWFTISAVYEHTSPTSTLESDEATQIIVYEQKVAASHL